MKDKGILWVIATVILAICAGALGMYTFGPVKTETVVTKTHTVEKPIILEAGTVHTQTNSIEYVKKEFDLVTGELEKTDAEYQIQKPQVTVKVNGKESAFNLLEDENWKFDKGKLLYEQSSKIDMTFQLPEIDRTKKHSLYYGFNSKGYDELTYSRNVTPRWGWYGGVGGNLIQSGFNGDSTEVKEVRGGLKFSW